MHSRNRMNLMIGGQEIDRTPFIPTICEHGATLLNKSPAEVSQDWRLMAQAALQSYATYKHDLVTVGIDIHGIEAEAFGCEIRSTAEDSVPSVSSHPLAEDVNLNPCHLSIPEPGSANRLGLITEAARDVVKEIGDEVWVYAWVAGPFSQAVELRSYEKLVIDALESPEAVHKLMEKTTELTLQQSARLSQQGCGIFLHESLATMPLIEPEIFREFIAPYHKKVMAFVRHKFQTPPPSIIMGGDSTRLAVFFLEIGASLMTADYNTDFSLLREKTEHSRMIIQGSVDPKMIERAEWKILKSAIRNLATKSRGMKTFVWGCGCVSYLTSKANLLQFKNLCFAVEALRKLQLPHH